ncbi:ABC transporter ATP-binding protein [Chelativorans sp. Marseille-P2723]|uniref:ABC transporter ATP-binding protein n=1 Tax=Chelativorans sp. Marseille-P2723 TaxID=2709133 RepID=UPI0015707BDA|nr:ABC transporter ATP-binding protein [Chelativorans sp. Marseille-P2723]
MTVAPMADVPDPTRPSPALSGSIQIENVTKVYQSRGQRTVGVENINLAIEPGEFVVLIGRSGCGKSTLLRTLAGLQPPTTGRIRINEKSLYQDDGRIVPRVIGDLGFVFQDANLLPWRSVWKNIALPLEVQKVPKEKRRLRAEQLAELAGLKEFLDHLPKALSGGMRQRVAIMRALAAEPSILLMDEPFSALDAITRDELNLALQDIWLRYRKTVVLVTHSITEAAFLADRIVLLSPHPGRVQRIIPVPFERPRPLSITKSVEFQALVSELRVELGE